MKTHQAQAKNFCRVLDIRVSEVVKPDVLRADGLQDLLMGVPEGIRVEHGAGLGRHKQVRTVGVLCVFLHQQLHRPLRDGQLADGVGRFGLADYQFTVETVALLSRETNPLTVEVRMEVETGEVKEHPTYKRIQEYVQEKYGFKVHTAYIAEVKRMVGLDMHKAPNAVEQRKHEYHPCPPEKVEAIKDALRHFGLVSE